MRLLGSPIRTSQHSLLNRRSFHLRTHKCSSRLFQGDGLQLIANGFLSLIEGGYLSGPFGIKFDDHPLITYDNRCWRYSSNRQLRECLGYWHR